MERLLRKSWHSVMPCGGSASASGRWIAGLKLGSDHARFGKKIDCERGFGIDSTSLMRLLKQEGLEWTVLCVFLLTAFERYSLFGRSPFRG